VNVAERAGGREVGYKIAGTGRRSFEGSMGCARVVPTHRPPEAA